MTTTMTMAMTTIPGIHHTVPSWEFITALGPIIAMAYRRRDVGLMGRRGRVGRLMGIMEL